MDVSEHPSINSENAMPEDTEPPFVSVIIPVYNDGEKLRQCLDLLEQQTYPAEAYEVVVVDNNSDESISPLLEPFPHARGAFEDQPGPYAARNTGLQMSQGEVIAFTDADCLPDARWLEEGVHALQGQPNVGLVGGAIQFSFRTPDRPTAIELYDSVHHLQQKEYVEETRYGATANVFTSRSVIEQVGDFAASVHPFSVGDREWGQRVDSAGFDLHYAPKARIVHPARFSWAELIKKERRAARGGMNREAERFSSSLHHQLYLLMRVLRAATPPRFSRMKRQAEEAQAHLPVRIKAGFYLVSWAVRVLRKVEKLRWALKKDANGAARS